MPNFNFGAQAFIAPSSQTCAKTKKKSQKKINKILSVRGVKEILSESISYQ